jgi:AAA domain-containing protein
MSRVSAAHRFSVMQPCPVCGGHDALPRGEGIRCAGFRSNDGRWGHCTREEYAGGLPLKLTSLTYMHRLDSPCRCGVTHTAVSLARSVRSGPNGHSFIPASRRIVATYPYRDESGVVLFEVVRFEPKGFSQRRPDGRAGWIANLTGVRRVLFGLPELKGQERVYLAEGEKDVEALWAEGLPATTNPGGAGSWRDDYAQQLRAAGVEVAVIIPDNDHPGMAHAAAVKDSCESVGLVTHVVTLPGLRPVREKHGEDVSDWLGAGHSVAELEALVEAALAAPASATQPSRGFEFRPIGELLAEPDVPLEWLVEGLLPREAISLLVGRPKSGKTTLCRTLAADVEGATPFLSRATVQGPVIYVSLEDSTRAVTAHFRRLGVASDAPLYVVCAQAPPDALQILRREVERREPVLVVIDTLYRFAKVRDVAAYGEVTAALQPLLALQRDLRFHLLLVHHSPKGADATRDAIDAGLGSTALPGTVDLALFLRCFPDGRRTLCSSPRSECGDPLPETVLRLNPKTGRPELGGTRQAADEAAMRQAMLDYLAAQLAPVERSEIYDAVEGRAALKGKVLRQFVEEGLVVKTGAGKKGDPFVYAVSRSLVPAYRGEQENEQPKPGLSAHQNGLYSDSRKIGVPSTAGDSQEPVSQAVEEVDL